MAEEFKTPITKLLKEMTSAELTFWWGEYQREFFGADRDYYTTSRVQASIGNFAGRVLPEGEFMNPIDLMPFLDQPEEVDEDEDPEIEAARVGHALNAVMGLQQQQADRLPKD